MSTGRRVARRRGRWTYVIDPMNGPRWRLDGTTLDLEFDPLDSGSALRGAWQVWIDGSMALGVYGIDHFLDGSMEHVEQAVDDPDSFSGGQDWAETARKQLRATPATAVPGYPPTRNDDGSLIHTETVKTTGNVL